MTADQLRVMLDNPDELFRFAGSIGLATEAEDTPQKVISKLLQLAVRVDNIPDYNNI